MKPGRHAAKPWGRRTASAIVVAFGTVLAIVASAPQGHAAGSVVQTGPDAFGYTAIQSSGLTNFPKWRGALERYFNETRKPQKSCESDWFTACKVKDWKAFLESIASLPRLEQLSRVNSFLNKERYILDIVNWHVPDYWAAPYQFLDRDGDCEDYAIAKFMSLRALGFPNSMLRIVVLRDLNLRVGHAILVVEMNGKKYVLDNQLNGIVTDTVIHHYRPIYAVNETNWWLYRQR